MTDRDTQATESEREKARQLYASDDVEIDDDATVSRGEDGAWVQAWVFVPKETE